MNRCPACGADVTRAIDAETGQPVYLEATPDSATAGVARYCVIQMSTPPVVRRVAVDATGSYYADHTADCDVSV